MAITKIRFLRDSKNWSQEYVASKLNITQTAYSKLESGQTKLTTERIEELAALFEVSKDYFLSNELPMVNYNNGTHSKAVFNPNQYYDTPKELYEDLIKSKDETINLLQEQVAVIRKEKEQLMKLVEKLSG
jgi:transcriptional regulator with XRE-family HTH domain